MNYLSDAGIFLMFMVGGVGMAYLLDSWAEAYHSWREHNFKK